MKKTARWILRHESLTAALSFLAVFGGVTVVFPARGILTALPAGFCLFLLAAFLRHGFAALPFAACLFSALLGFGLGMASPLIYAGVCTALCLLACAAAAGVRAFLSARRKGWILLSFFALAAGAVLPLIVYGSPGAILAAGTRAETYLLERYPDQVFTRVVCYRDPAAGVWHTDCSYPFEGNDLTSVILFGETVTDGFLADRMAAAQETRRSQLIEVLGDGTEEILVEPEGFSEALATRSVISGVYGQYDAALEGEMRFTLTFRREKPQKREFVLAVRDAVRLLREKEFDFDQIRFVGLSAGAPVYRCAVTRDTPPEELMDRTERI